MANSIDDLASELAKYGFHVRLERCKSTWWCELKNRTLGFFPIATGLTAVEAIREAARHPEIEQVVKV